MGRPKTARKPSKRALARQAKKQARGRLLIGGHNDFITVDRTGGVVYNVTGDVGGAGGGSGGQITLDWPGTVDWQSIAVRNDDFAALTVGTSVTVAQQAPPSPNTITIESLDEGVTWHTADTLEPAVNADGELRIGTMPCGRAPESMRHGSGVYRFEIECRWATEDEIDTWVAQQPDRQANWARTAEERAAAQAEVERKAREAADGREKAERRARELLRSHLNATQRVDFESRGGFWVKSQHGNRYWVTPSTAVRFDDHGVALQRYCIHTVDYSVPREDNALLRMLLLMCNEDEFLNTANPGPPSEWDLRRSESLWPTTFVDTPTGGEMRLVAGNAGTGLAGNVQIVSSNWRVVQDLNVCRPAMRYINGIVRPLSV